MVHTTTCIQLTDRFTAIALLGNSLDPCLFLPSSDAKKTQQQEINLDSFRFNGKKVFG